MFCTNCGRKNDDDAQVCIWCSRNIERRTIFPYRFRKLALIALVVAALGVGAKTVFDINRAMNLSVSVKNPNPRQQISIVDDQFRVAKGAHWQQRFDVLQGWKNVRIVGKFTAASTTTEGVSFFVTSESNLAEFLSKGECPTLYSSGHTTS